MAIYTKRGDKGNTDLFSGQRIKKYDLQVESYGVIDEANSTLGVARANTCWDDIAEVILKVQQKLFVVATELATHQQELEQRISKSDVSYLEEKIDFFTEQKIAQQGFVVPGDSKVGSYLDLARTIVRRAERRIVELSETEYEVKQELLSYINRLSDLLYTLARVEDSRKKIYQLVEKVLKEVK